MERVDYGSSLDIAKQLGYTGSSNSEFDTWFKSLSDLEKEAITSGNYALLSYIKAYQSTDDPYRRQQLENSLNAYRSQSYEPNFFQRIGEDIFGDTSSRTNFINQTNDKLIQDIKGIQEGLHTEDYTDPASEVARKKAAGLNVDLTGGERIGSGQPGAIDEPELAPGVVNDGYSALPEIGSAVAQVFSMSMSFAQAFQGLSAGSIQIASEKLGLLDSVDNFLISQIGNRLTEDDIKSILNKDDKSSDSRLASINKLQDVLGILTEDRRLPRSVRKAMSSYHGRMLDPESIGVDSKLYSLIEGAYQHKKGAVENAGNPFTQGGFEECLETFGKYVNETVIRVQKLQAKYDSDRLSVSQDGKSLGTLAGEADAKAFSSAAFDKEFESIQNEMWSNIMTDLKKQNTWWSKILLFAVPIVRMWLNNLKMPSVSHTTSSGVDAKGNAISSSSSSFGF